MSERKNKTKQKTHLNVHHVTLNEIWTNLSTSTQCIKVVDSTQSHLFPDFFGSLLKYKLEFYGLLFFG